MEIAPFAVEEFYARYEFSVPYNLSASDCETMTVAELLALSGRGPDAISNLHLGYSDSQGHPDLRSAIAATYDDVHPEHVVVLGAPEEGIFVTMHTLLEPGDEVVVLTPAYNSLRNLAEHVCGPENVRRWEVEATADGWHLDLEELEPLLTPRTKLLVVNFPHNPTGYLPDRAQFEAIVDVARQRGLWLLCDEMYRGLELGDTAQLPSAADLYERAIVLAGLSKVHGLPGLRSGWLVVRDADVRARLINWKHYTTICAPAPSEFLARVALEAQPALIARNRAIIESNLEAADAFFARWPDTFTWRCPPAGSVALVEVHVPSATAFCDDLIREAGILLLPSTALDYGDKHVRFGPGRGDFAANLDHLERYLQQMALT